MAKKKQELSEEELLEQALVPESEWPYEVPGNWVWVRLDSISEIITGGTPSKNNDKYYGGEFPFIKPADLDQGRHVIFATEYLSDEGKKVSRLIPSRSISVCCIGTIGKCGYLEIESSTNQQINSIIPKIENLYIYYYCCSDYFVHQLVDLSSATTISIVNKGKMSKTSFPLPPLSEQQRIVARIESLFEKLDQAKGLIQEALDSFENRKAAILHKAFSGELTRKWREENGVGMESWDSYKFGEVAEIKSNLVDPQNFLDYPHIAPDNIEKRTGCLLDFRTIREDGVTSSKHRFYPGQIIYSKIRPYLSKVVVVDFEGLCSADMYPIETNQNTKFLWYFMLSDEFLEQASSAGSRSILPKINQRELSTLQINIPTILEQKEIVRILDDILDKEQTAKDRYTLVNNIDLMKKSILARAFRGELGTNDPEEESALELLKAILKK